MHRYVTVQRYGGDLIYKSLGITGIDVVVYCGIPSPSKDVCPIQSGEAEECSLREGTESEHICVRVCCCRHIM